MLQIGYIYIGQGILLGHYDLNMWLLELAGTVLFDRI